MVCFTAADLTLFAEATHDRNPLHNSPSYARKTPFGQPVVFGALGALACWTKLQPPAEKRISRLTIEFSRPLFLDVPYQLEESDGVVRILDGSTQILRAQAEYEEGESRPVLFGTAEIPAREYAATHADADIRPGLSAAGTYQPARGALAALLERMGIHDAGLPLIALLWSSYLAGMELPGERALYFKLAIQFPPIDASEMPLFWTAKLLSRNPINQLRMAFSLSTGRGLVAEGSVEAFLRPLPIAAIYAYKRSQELAGKTAVVTGASRGLGAAITRALVRRGATVIANYQSSRNEAEELAASLDGEFGNIILRQGDAADPAWALSLLEEFGSPDFLILNACPSVPRIWIEAATVARVNEYVARAFAMVSTPLAVFAPSMREWVVLISSIYTETLPKEFPHYVAVKAAVEGLLCVTAQQHRKPAYLIVRPPKLLTDMTNSPYGVKDALDPGVIASALVERLLTPPPEPGTAEVLPFKTC